MQIFLFYCVIEACQTIRLLPPWNLKSRRQRYAKEWQELNSYKKTRRISIILADCSPTSNRCASMCCIGLRVYFLHTSRNFANQLQSVLYLGWEQVEKSGPRRWSHVRRRRPERYNGAVTIGLVAASHGLYVVVVVVVFLFFGLKPRSVIQQCSFQKRKKEKKSVLHWGEREKKKKKGKKSIAKATSFCPAVVSSIIARAVTDAAAAAAGSCVLLYMFTLLFSLCIAFTHSLSLSLLYSLIFLSIYFVVHVSNLFSFWRK